MKRVLASVVPGILVLSVGFHGLTAFAGESVKDTPLAVSTERAFPNLEFNRPIVVTHAGDATNRVFVAEQEGIIKVFKNDQETEEATVLKVPCLTLRNTTERPETVNMGTNELVGDDFKKLEGYLKNIIAGNWKEGSIPPLWDGKTAVRIINKLIELYSPVPISVLINKVL